MSEQRREAVVQALNELEQRLGKLGVPAGDRPTPEALASTMPFCYDTMDVEAWLQFIFLGRMRELLEQGDPLPESCAITPYLEMLRASGRSVDPEICDCVGELDRLITGESGSGERI